MWLESWWGDWFIGFIIIFESINVIFIEFFIVIEKVNFISVTNYDFFVTIGF